LIVEPATRRPLWPCLRRCADPDEVGRARLELRDLRRQIEGAELEIDGALELDAVFLHEAGQHLFPHDARDGVIVGVGHRAGRDGIALGFQRAHHAVEHVAFVGGVAEGVFEVRHQLRRGGGHGHDHHAAAVGRRCRDLDLARAERANDREHLVVFGELAQADDRLAGVARRVERDVAQALAVDAARGVDLVDCDARRYLVGARQAHEGPGFRGEKAQRKLALRKRRGGSKGQDGEQQFGFHRVPPPR
jgi:hypothetical protein